MKIQIHDKVNGLVQVGKLLQFIAFHRNIVRIYSFLWREFKCSISRISV